MSNMTSLIDRGWVKTVDQEKTVNTARGTTIPSVVTAHPMERDAIINSWPWDDPWQKRR
jgi:hypothetical protein